MKRFLPKHESAFWPVLWSALVVAALVTFLCAILPGHTVPNSGELAKRLVEENRGIARIEIVYPKGDYRFLIVVEGVVNYDRMALEYNLTPSQYVPMPCDLVHVEATGDETFLKQLRITKRMTQEEWKRFWPQ